MKYQPVIGLEIHVQLKTDTKIFCGCSTKFGAEPNSQTCPVCLGLPGALPVLNKKVVEFAIKAGLATNCSIAHRSVFARKNYFYPDLPKGYQISQLEEPICQRGWLDIKLEGEEPKRVGITRIHMEEDAGKLVHADFPGLDDGSGVDLNRACTPLLEVVSEPDLRSSDEAVVYLKKVHQIVTWLGICDGSMEEGSFRCDANVSVMPVGSDTFGTRAEIKNVNSFRFVKQAIEYEIRRQIELIEDGGRVVQETRLFDPVSGTTRSMRGKEEAHDYRYFPDPDLVPLVINDDWIQHARQGLPELPEQRRQRFITERGLPEYDAEVLTANRALADYFEAGVEAYGSAKPVANWVMGEITRVLNDSGASIENFPITPMQLADLLKLIDIGTISGKIAKTVFDEMLKGGKSPASIVEELGLVQLSDGNALEIIIDEIMAANAGQVEEYRSGKEKVFGFFVGQIMKASGGKANPTIVNELLRNKLRGENGGNEMNQTVMIVDDSFFMRNILRGMLEEKGYVVVAEAASGIEAMKNLHSHKPDIIMLDIILPDSSSLDLLQSILDARPDSAVVVCSAIGQDAVVKRALELGAKAYIHKPFTPEKVIGTLEGLAG